MESDWTNRSRLIWDGGHLKPGCSTRSSLRLCLYCHATLSARFSYSAYVSLCRATSHAPSSGDLNLDRPDRVRIGQKSVGLGQSRCQGCASLMRFPVPRQNIQIRSTPDDLKTHGDTGPRLGSSNLPSSSVSMCND
jgi:hypothetical protein